MSHVSKVDCTISDLDALEQALGKFTGTALKRNQATFRGYGRESSPCVHAITIPGTQYEVGLRWKSASNKAEGFEPATDYYDGAVAKTFGANMMNLRNEYSAVVAENTLRKAGRMVRRQIDTPQHIQLVAY